MNDYIYPASLNCDFYKIGHKQQYPSGTQSVYSNFTPRGSRVENVNKVVAFGIQSFVKKWLIEDFNKNFFNLPRDVAVNQYYRIIRFTLGIESPDVSHIEALHDLGYLPIKLRAVKEGTLVPVRVPMFTVESTKDEFFWVTNYIETQASAEIWGPSTSATIANQYRLILERYALETVGNTDFVPFQGHDFSYRGMMGREAAKLSGAGHLTSFVGTDTIPAILFLEEFYNANIENELVGTSVNATEHSVMCAGGKKDEYETYRRLIQDVYKAGVLSIVSDTWNLWHVLASILPRLKNIILDRDGKVVIRPDSGDPVLIICGDSESKDENIRKGVIELLWEIFGGIVNDNGYRELDPHIGAIYGDSITLERADAICAGLMKKGFASTNIVFGIGSYTYQYQTRDTFKFAMKATHVVVNGEERNIIKDPITDDGTKKSLTGRVVVFKSPTGEILVADSRTIAEQEQFKEFDLLEDVFVDGKLVRDESLAEIRARLKGEI